MAAATLAAPAGAGVGTTSGMVLVYNVGGVEVHDIKPLKHVIKMLHRGVVRILEAVEGETFGPYQRPRSVELVRYIYAKWKYQRSASRHVSKRGVLVRDRYTCAYCGRSATTVDHVVPRCQGGLSTWVNLVAACVGCNSRKKGRTPKQAGMVLMWEGFDPSRRAW